jgi:hypothetical protein
MYEPRGAAPVPRARFLRRVARHFAVASALVLGSVGGGMVGYHHFEGLGWLDAFLNAAMLLGGMGPVEMPRTSGGKLFAGFYALYSGLVFIIGVGIVGAPLLHRLMHKFHWDEEEEDPREAVRRPAGELREEDGRPPAGEIG